MDNRTNVLELIHEGMDVYNVNGDRIGEVRVVFLGGVADEVIALRGEGADSPAVDLGGEDPLIEDIAESVNVDEVPTEIAERMLRDGYVLMNAAGILKADRFIMPEHIESVSEEGVRLNVEGDGLLRR